MSTLKELTWAKHQEAESQSFIKSIFKGNVDENKYIDYLYQLRLLYDKLENLGDAVGIFEDMEELKRTRAITLDYAELTEGRTDNDPVRKSTLEYLQYLDTIREDKTKLMAHIYVRHTGDLFGGQALAKLLPGPNHMFKFNNIPELVQKIRSKLDVSLAEEAIKAFDYNINMIKEYND